MSKAPQDADFFNEKLSIQERNLYDRQFRLSGWRQEILKNSRVLIIGVGGLGCEIAKNLAMVGVGHMDLVDMDTIEYSNLNRQILFVGATMGEPKAVAAARQLKLVNPSISIVAHHCALEQLDPQIFKDADVIIGGLDSVKARRNLNAQAVRFKKPLIDGGVSGYHGHVYTTFPFENACYECYPTPIPEIDDMNACTVVGVPRKRNHCLLKANMAFKEKFQRDPNVKSTEDLEFLLINANSLVSAHNFLPLFTQGEVVNLIDRHEPGIITINAVIASLQSHETIKILNWLKGNEALGLPQRDYVIYNGMTMKFYWMEKPRNIECTQCGKNVRRLEISLEPTDICKKIVEEVQKKGFELDPEMEPTISCVQFEGPMEIDLNLSPAENKLRPYDLLTVVGMKGGPILINIIFFLPKDHISNIKKDVKDMSLRDNRITEEFAKLKKLYSDGVILQLKAFDANRKSVDHLAVSFKGPKGSPYEKGIFKLEIKFPADYPNLPPFVRLHTGIWHPNFWPSPAEYPGQRNICLALVDPTLVGQKGGWSPSKTIITVIQAILAMLNVEGQYINPTDVFNKKAALEMMKDQKEFTKKCKFLAEKYAKDKW